jgi:hypothetical protein
MGRFVMTDNSAEVSWRKERVFETLRLLADEDAQDNYNRQVPIAEVAVELVNQWFDDSFLLEEPWFREIFSRYEWNILSEFNQFFERRLGNLPAVYSELRTDQNWAEVRLKAQWALDKLSENK